ncbi:MAG: BMP family ABC transporter substrate-binding protein [Devosia sp.]
MILIVVIVLIIVAAAAWYFLGRGGAGGTVGGPAVLYDGGGKFDKGFNESAFNGATQWAKETGKTFGDLELTGGDAQRDQSLRQFAERGYSPILVPGFNWVTALTTVAKEFPKTQFVIIDSFIDLPNVKSIEFKEQEGSYLVGIMAAMASKTGTIGVVPAFNFELLEAFACGYKQGALSVNPNIRVLENYVGTGFEAFNDPAKATEAAKTQIDQGADVVFAVAGGAGNGVLQAAADAGKLGIGVDQNQNYMHPGKVLTSMQKRVDVATYQAFTDATKGVFKADHTVLGVAENGVGPAFDDFNKSLVTPEMKAAVDKATADIISGAVKVHDFRSDKACNV